MKLLYGTKIILMSRLSFCLSCLITTCIADYLKLNTKLSECTCGPLTVKWARLNYQSIKILGKSQMRDQSANRLAYNSFNNRSDFRILVLIAKTCCCQLTLHAANIRLNSCFYCKVKKCQNFLKSNSLYARFEPQIFAL